LTLNNNENWVRPTQRKIYIIYIMLINIFQKSNLKGYIMSILLKCMII